MCQGRNRDPSLTECKAYLFQPFCLHVVSIHSSGGLGVEHGSSLSDSHGLVVVHSKHLVEVRHRGLVTARPAVVASYLLGKLAVLWQFIGPPWVRLRTVSSSQKINHLVVWTTRRALVVRLCQACGQRAGCGLGLSPGPY